MTHQLAQLQVGTTLDAWLAKEADVLASLNAGPGPGVARPDQVAHLTGMGLMHAMLRSKLHYAAIAKTVDFTIIEVSEGHAVFQGTPGPAYLNPMGGIHGGWYATMLDSALGCAIHTLMPVGRGYTTAELSVDLVKAINPAEARIVGPHGRLYAHATTTCLVFELKRPG